jgi:hypothetical protein
MIPGPITIARLAHNERRRASRRRSAPVGAGTWIVFILVSLLLSPVVSSCNTPETSQERQDRLEKRYTDCLEHNKDNPGTCKYYKPQKP